MFNILFCFTIVAQESCMVVVKHFYRVKAMQNKLVFACVAPQKKSLQKKQQKRTLRKCLKTV